MSPQIDIRKSVKNLDAHEMDKEKTEDKSEDFLLNNLEPLWKLENTVWPMVVLLLYLHLEALRYLWIVLFWNNTSLQNILFQIIYGYIGAFGIVAGGHRLWSHRSYKAKLPLRLILLVFQTIAGQSSIWRWTKDHRLHHKFSETNADPHNAQRGFFFSHVGWLLCPEHEMVTKKFKTIDMSDLAGDSLVMFQYRNYHILSSILCFILPTWISYSVFGEDLLTSWSSNIFRYVVNLNAVFCINSWAHKWGPRPYDKKISPSESRLLSILTCGEGWHNYHHTFSWDYKAAELGFYKYNLCTAFIDFFAWIGWAYDLKTVPMNIVLDRVRRTGDGSYDNHQNHSERVNYEINKDNKEIKQ